MKKMIPLTLMLALVGCASPQLMQDIATKRAEFDFNCPKSSITSNEISGHTIGVVACDNRAVYLMRGPCDNVGHCSAVLNSVDSVKVQ